MPAPSVRSAREQHLALGQRLAHQPELVVLEVTQAAVDQLRARRRSVRREVVLLAQHHRQAAPGEIARDAGSVDAAAHHEHIARSVRDAG
jgi:cell division protein FtsB